MKVNGKDDIPYIHILWKIKAMFETTNQLLMVAYGTNQNSGSFHIEKTRICITQILVGDHEMIVNWDVRITNWHEPLTQHNLRGILVLNLDELEFHSHKLIFDHRTLLGNQTAKRQKHQIRQCGKTCHVCSVRFWRLKHWFLFWSIVLDHKHGTRGA